MGRKSYAERDPELVLAARRLYRRSPKGHRYGWAQRTASARRKRERDTAIDREKLDPKKSGKFFNYDGREHPW
jgi:hypothetical protein